MIVEMLLIGGAIGLFTKRNRDRKDISDDYSTSYSNSYSNSYTPSYYNRYNCFDEEQDEEEDNNPQDYSYIDFENALDNHIYQYYSHSSHREKKKIRNKLNKIYYHVYRKTKKIPSFDEVSIEYSRRKNIGVNVKNIDQFLMDNSERIILEKAKHNIRKKRISIIMETYNLNYASASRKYYQLRGVVSVVNARMERLLKNKEIYNIYNSSLEDVINDFSQSNHYANEINIILGKDTCNEIVRRSILKSMENVNLQVQFEAIKDMILF